MNISDEIKRLHDLHLAGALTEAEFSAAKEKLLSESKSASAADDFVQQTAQFRRSRSDRWFGGICGGLAKVSGLESWAWRLMFVLFAFTFGIGFLAYLLGWIFIPEEDAI